MHMGDLLTALIDVIELVLAIAFVKALIKLFDVTNKKIVVHSAK